MTPSRRWGVRRLLLWTVVLGLVAAVAYVPVHQRRQQRQLARLERTRDALREELTRLLEANPRLSAAPPGGVLIGAPAPFVEGLAHQLVGGLLEHTEIRLTNLKARKRGQVNVGTLLGRMTPGSYSLDVTVRRIRGRLKADAPSIRFQGDRAHVRIPASIREGSGQARIRFQWESSGLAGLACGDIDVTETVSGRVRPHSYVVEGDLDLALEDRIVNAVPRVPDLRIRLYVEPTKASWAVVDRLLDRQGFRCRTALKLVDVPKALQGVLDKGLNVKIPGRIFKPVRLPAGFGDSVTLDGTTYDLAVEPRGLVAAEDILWYGADLSARVEDVEAETAVQALPAASPVPIETPRPAEAPAPVESSVPE